MQKKRYIIQELKDFVDSQAKELIIPREIGIKWLQVLDDTSREIEKLKQDNQEMMKSLPSADY